MKKSVENIYKEIDNLKKRLERIQDKCPHKNCIKTYKGDTGNFDPNDDYYITCFHCQDCDKRWFVEGSE